MRAGGHSNTVDTPGETSVPVDTGFIVYNTVSYPNLIALFAQLGVPTAKSDMSFAVSLDHGGYEYAGSGLTSLFGQLANVVRPSHWRMTTEIFRFFRNARELAAQGDSDNRTLGGYLTAEGYSDAFITRHILPMAAAIWSTPSRGVLEFPIAAFVRFFDNHGLLQVQNRPEWRTVAGGSREYVRRILADFDGQLSLGQPVTRVVRRASGTTLSTPSGDSHFDATVIATHADDALALLSDPSSDETRLLGAFRYVRNHAVLHTDEDFMPSRRRLWSSWNYIGSSGGIDTSLAVTYWMNRLQPLGAGTIDHFVTLNPMQDVDPRRVVARFDYSHPMFDQAAIRAQRDLWSLQGVNNTWFCGSYFGYGFHEDGLQSGLAAAEDIGGVRRPWSVANESSRIHVRPGTAKRERTIAHEAAE